MKLMRNRTKIMATVGPAIADYDIMVRMVEAGVNVFRLNFSHGGAESHAAIMEMIRRINEELGARVGILADLQGPKMRIGEVRDGHIELHEGHELTITSRELESNPDNLSISYPAFARDILVGDRVLIDDGKVELEVLSTDRKSEVRAKVLFGGELGSRKGVNLPNTRISVPSLTDKDKDDLRFILENDVQWIALSFVRKADDMRELRGIISFHNRPCRIIAKIERPEALNEIDGIIEAADGVMIARGDLGVEVAMERIPMIQKAITAKCIEAAKPVVIATQMMESMIEASRPTRAEATDVANAVLDGADVLMLSGETSVGKYPVKVVESMHKIIREVEGEPRIYHREIKPRKESPTWLSDAVCYNACVIAKHVNARAIMGMTRSGYTAFQLSCQRPDAEIYIFTDSVNLIRALSLVWGVHAFYYDRFESTDSTILEVQEILKEQGLVRRGDIVLNTGSMPLGERGKTNMLKVSVVK